MLKRYSKLVTKVHFTLAIVVVELIALSMFMLCSQG